MYSDQAALLVIVGGPNHRAGAANVVVSSCAIYKSIRTNVNTVALFFD